jgi:hypothetical protein
MMQIIDTPWRDRATIKKRIADYFKNPITEDNNKEI